MFVCCWAWSKNFGAVRTFAAMGYKPARRYFSVGHLVAAKHFAQRFLQPNSGCRSSSPSWIGSFLPISARRLPISAGFLSARANSLLLFTDQIRLKGFLIAATNLDQSLDPAVWRRFDEVVWFERPNRRLIDRFLRMKFKNVATAFDPAAFISSLEGYSYAEIERVCIQAIESMIVERRGRFRSVISIAL